MDVEFENGEENWIVKIVVRLSVDCYYRCHECIIPGTQLYSMSLGKASRKAQCGEGVWAGGHDQIARPEEKKLIKQRAIGGERKARR